MRKHLFYLLLLGTVFTQAQQVAPEIEWARNLGTTLHDNAAKNVALTPDGGYMVFGGTNKADGDVSANYGLRDYWVAKLDANGILEWEKNYGGSEPESGFFNNFYKIVPALDGGYILAGGSSSNDGDVSEMNGQYFGDYWYSEGDVWLVKIDEVGNIEWENNYGGMGRDDFMDIEPTADGGFVFIAQSTSNDGDVESEYIDAGAASIGWIVKIDAEGNIEWQNEIGGYTGVAKLNAVSQTADGGFMAIGGADAVGGNIPFTTQGGADILVFKFNETGSFVWSKNYGGTSQDLPKRVRGTADGGAIIVGDIWAGGGDITNFYGSRDIWVLKIDEEGEIEWENTYGTSESEVVHDVQITSDGDYIIGGFWNSLDYFLMRIDSAGELKWEKSFGGSGADNLWGVDLTPDGGFITIGDSNSNDGDVPGNHGGFDILVVKLSPDCLAPDFTVETEFVVCEGENLSIAVTTDGDTVNWYESADAETPFFTGTALELENLTESVTYWVEALSYVCAAERTEVTITVNPLPELILDEVELAVCAGENANLFAFSEGNVIFWYENEEDEEYLYHGNNFIVEDLAEGTHTYWVEAYNLAAGCVSEREEVTITVNPVPNAPEAIGNFEFDEGDTLADLEDSLGYEGELTWYADEYLTVELPATTTLVDGAIYYVTQTIGDCESEGLEVQAEENTLSTTNIHTTDFSYYPNPVKDKLNFTGKEKVESLQVFDMSGRLVLTEAAKGQTLTSINLSTLPAGAYLLKVKTDKGIKTIRIVRN